MGTPDFDDFQTGTREIHRLRSNNNRQKQVKDITDTVNKTLLPRNRAFITDLDNIIVSIALAQF